MGGNSSIQRNEKALERRRITRDDFLLYIKEMNTYFSHHGLSDGSKLLFAISKDSKSKITWKDDMAILCFRIQNIDNKRVIKGCKTLNFDSFMNAYEMKSITNITQQDWMATSTTILSETADVDGFCIICYDNPNSILLPCLHSFCATCIANESEYRPQFRCPLCQKTISNPLEESWDVPDYPNKEEIDNYLSQIPLNN